MRTQIPHFNTSLLWNIWQRLLQIFCNNAKVLCACHTEKLRVKCTYFSWIIRSNITYIWNNQHQEVDGYYVLKALNLCHRSDRECTEELLKSATLANGMIRIKLKTADWRIMRQLIMSPLHFLKRKTTVKRPYVPAVYQRGTMISNNNNMRLRVFFDIKQQRTTIRCNSFFEMLTFLRNFLWQ